LERCIINNCIDNSWNIQQEQRICSAKITSNAVSEEEKRRLNALSKAIDNQANHLKTQLYLKNNDFKILMLEQGASEKQIYAETKALASKIQLPNHRAEAPSR
jgi:hypothetical protein